jgi:pilus assembly protein Flp/PilA
MDLWSRLIARSQAGGQALIEYVLIIVLVTIAIIAVLAITGPAVGNVFSNTVYNLLGGTVEPRNTLSADEFWEQVAAVASYTPESPSLMTNTPAPSTAVPTLKPTAEPTDAPPTAIPTDTVTPGPSPTPPDHDFGYPFDDPGNDPDWWEHNFGGPFDKVEWNAEYWDLSGSPAGNMDGTAFDPGKGRYREKLTAVDKNWGTNGPGGGTNRNF